MGCCILWKCQSLLVPLDIHQPYMALPAGCSPTLLERWSYLSFIHAYHGGLDVCYLVSDCSNWDKVQACAPDRQYKDQARHKLLDHRAF